MNFKEGAYLTLIRNVGDAMNLFEFFRKKEKNYLLKPYVRIRKTQSSAYNTNNTNTPPQTEEEFLEIVKTFFPRSRCIFSPAPISFVLLENSKKEPASPRTSLIIAR